MAGALDYTVKPVLMTEIFSDEEFNCRGRIAPIDVHDLAQSIAKQDLQAPITVQPFNDPARAPGKKYRIIAGHRRFMACRVLQWETIPAMVRVNLSDLEARALNLVENLKRKELNMAQEMKALLPFQKAKWKHDIIAAELGVSRGWVQVRMMLLSLPDDVQQEAAAGMLNQEQIRQLYTIRDDLTKVYEAVRTIKDRRRAGEDHKIQIVPKKVNPLRKDARTPEEIFKIQELIQSLMGDSLVTRIMGWCAGTVTDMEIHRDIRDASKLCGRHYEIPKEFMVSF